MSDDMESAVDAGGSGEVGGARTSRRMSSADTPSHAAEPPPALRSYNLRYLNFMPFNG